jgi:hypothetical protein
MSEISYTTLGGNALLTGIIAHIAAVVIAVMPVSGTTLFSGILFPFSCLALAAGSYAELQHRSCRPFTDRRLYVIAAATLLPIMGPLIISGILYTIRGKEEKTGLSIPGMISAMLRLKANPILLFLLIIIILLFFALIHSQDDPYFRKRLRSEPETPVNTVISASVAYPSRIAE